MAMCIKEATFNGNAYLVHILHNAGGYIGCIKIFLPRYTVHVMEMGWGEILNHIIKYVKDFITSFVAVNDNETTRQADCVNPVLFNPCMLSSLDALSNIMTQSEERRGASQNDKFKTEGTYCYSLLLQ